MKQQKIKFRKAETKDIPLIYTLINEMALYEKRPQDMTGTLKELEYWLFERNIASFYIAEIEKKVAGYALYYPVFGSFSAAGRVHLEDIYIREEFRNQGFGKTFFTFIADQILKEGFAGMEWSCLDWNDSALSFYDHIGAHREKGREYLFMSEEELVSLTKQFEH